MLCAVLLFEVSYHRYYCCTYQVLYVESRKIALTAQLSQAKAQQRRAVRCRTVPCLALRYCAVLRCAFFRTFSSTRYHAIPDTDRYVCTCVLVFFSRSSFDFLSRSPPFFLENYTHTGDQNVTSPTITHSTAQGNQLCVYAALGIIKSIICAPNHGLFFLPLSLLVLFSLARA